MGAHRTLLKRKRISGGLAESSWILEIREEETCGAPWGPSSSSQPWSKEAPIFLTKKREGKRGPWVLKGVRNHIEVRAATVIG